jgi:hypothetical protein
MLPLRSVSKLPPAAWIANGYDFYVSEKLNNLVGIKGVSSERVTSGTVTVGGDFSFEYITNN